MSAATRRRLLAGMAAWAALPTMSRLRAQGARLPTIAVLFVGDSDDDEPVARPFFDGMARFGWIEGKTINYDRHSGKGTLQYLETMAGNAADSGADLIFATTGRLATAVLKQTTAIPVVFVTITDPVAGGLVASLAKPGGNATGTFQMPGDAAAKRFALVRQAMPGIKRMGAVFDRNAAEAGARREMHEKAARAAGLVLSSAEFTNIEAIARLFAQFRRDGITLAEMTPSYALTGRRRDIVGLAEKNGIALVAHRIEWVEAGAVLSYGVDVGESYRRAAALANRVLKGARPAEIAVELPNRVELALNARAAQAFGITFPKALLQQAARVIA